MSNAYYVIADFSSTDDGELSLTAGTRVKVLEGGESDEPGWWSVETEDGLVGNFPSTYLEPLDESDADGGSEAAVESDSDDSVLSSSPAITTVSSSAAVTELLQAKKKDTNQKTDEEKLLATDEADQQDETKTKQLTAEEKRERYRSEVIGEILNTEADYVKDLEIIVRLFLMPMREKEIVPRAEISNLFSNVEAILSVNQELINSLAAHRSEPVFMVGQIFLKMIEFLKMYTIYCSNQPVALGALERLKSPTFDAFLEDRMKQEECRGLTLFSFLIKPIQRICKYPLLLKDLLRNTTPEHPDYANIQQALSKIEEVVAYVNERKRLAENLQKILDVQESIMSDEDLNLVEPGRRYCREGGVSLVIKGKPHERKIYLFNDLIMFTRPKKNLIGTVKDYFVAKFLIKDIRFTDIADSQDFKDVCEFSSKNSEERVLVKFASNDEKYEWVKDIKTLVKEFQKKEFLAKRDELKRAEARGGSDSGNSSPQAPTRAINQSLNESTLRDSKDVKTPVLDKKAVPDKKVVPEKKPLPEKAKPVPEKKPLPEKTTALKSTPKKPLSGDSSPTMGRSPTGRVEIPKGIKVGMPPGAKDDKKKDKKDDKKKKEKEKEFDKKVRSGSVECVETSVVKASQLDNDFRKNLQNIMVQKK